MATRQQFQVLEGPGQATKGRAGDQGRIATLKRLCRNIIRPLTRTETSAMPGRRCLGPTVGHA
jgi:hypothetical protein